MVLCVFNEIWLFLCVFDVISLILCDFIVFLYYFIDFNVFSGISLFSCVFLCSHWFLMVFIKFLSCPDLPGLCPDFARTLELFARKVRSLTSLSGQINAKTGLARTLPGLCPDFAWTLPTLVKSAQIMIFSAFQWICMNFIEFHWYLLMFMFFFRFSLISIDFSCFFDEF